MDTPHWAHIARGLFRAVFLGSRIAHVSYDKVERVWVAKVGPTVIGRRSTAKIAKLLAENYMAAVEKWEGGR